MNVAVRLLDPDDDRGSFQSGHAALDEFFRRFAGQNQFRHHYGATYVAIEDGAIAGYATVAGGTLGLELAGVLGRRTPGYPLPVLRLGRLAVDQRFQGLGVGQALLKHALTVALQMRDLVGCVGVLVDAKPEAVAFYEKYGFTQAQAAAPPAHSSTTLMFLPISAVPSRQ